jgi:hypothetical protein
MSMPATIIPKYVAPVTDEEILAQLRQQRAKTLERVANAVRQQRYWALRNVDEANAWKTQEQSLLIDVEMIDGEITHYQTPRNERYAELRAQMRHEDQHRAVVSDGSVDWENA